MKNDKTGLSNSFALIGTSLILQDTYVQERRIQGRKRLKRGSNSNDGDYVRQCWQRKYKNIHGSKAEKVYHKESEDANGRK